MTRAWSYISLAVILIAIWGFGVGLPAYLDMEALAKNNTGWVVFATFLVFLGWSWNNRNSSDD